MVQWTIQTVRYVVSSHRTADWRCKRVFRLPPFLSGSGVFFWAGNLMQFLHKFKKETRSEDLVPHYYRHLTTDGVAGAGLEPATSGL